MAIEKIQGQVIDVNSAPEESGVAADDYVLAHDKSTGRTVKVPVGSITKGISGAIRLRGSALMDDGSTTATSIKIQGDPLNASISQSSAPTAAPGEDESGIAYQVKTTAQNGVQTQISGTVQTVFDGDELAWFGGKWNVLETGAKVSSVDGQTGDVTVDKYSRAQADAKFPAKTSVYTKAEADAKFRPVSWTPSASDVGAYSKAETYSKSETDSGFRASTWVPSWNDVQGKPAKFPAEDHTHTWASINGKPVQFPTD